MLTDSETLSPEETYIRAKEGELRQNVNGAWACMTLTVIFAVIGSLTHETSGLRASDELLTVMMGFIVLIFVGLSVMAWCFVIRDRRLLVQLREIASIMANENRNGVWPPPPSVPSE